MTGGSAITVSLTDHEHVKLKKETQEQNLLTASFLLNSDCKRYGRLIEDLKNDYLQGHDRYPKALMAAFSLLTNWKQTVMRVMETPNDGVSFMNAGNQDREEPDMAL
jgi:hypothetical protein